ncbi:MAG: beta-galactosidase, partial [Armatimonadota bacterium]
MTGARHTTARRLARRAWPGLLALLWGVQTAAAQPATRASWIWYPEEPAVEGVDQTRYLRYVMRLPAAPEEAHLRARWDDSAKFTVNGQAPPTLRREGAAGVVYDLAPLLQAGENVLAFEVHNAVGVGGLIVNGTVTMPDGAVVRVFSDETWRASRTPAPGWELPGFDDGDWPAAAVVGSVFALPWYRHPAFEMAPYLEPDEMEAYRAWAAERMALPPGLEAEAPAIATLRQELGQAVLRIDGRARPALMYRGTIDPLTDHGRRQIGIFRDAGVHVYSAYYNLAQCWPAQDEYDLSRLDEIIRGYLATDPEAHIHLILPLTMPNWWMDAHPDEMVRYAAGDDFNSSDESHRVRRPSLASEAWQEAAMELWRRCITHLESRPWGRRVIGYQPGYGIYTEWHYFGSWTNQMPDTGPAMTRHFRLWLAERYKTDARLQAAWRDPDVTLATATVPGVAPRLAAGPLGLRDPAQGTWVMDYYRCQQELTADCIEMFCA